jgi:hypothetical protein
MVKRRVADVSRDVESHLSKVFSNYAYYSSTVDEPTGTTTTTRDVTSNFEVCLHSMRGHTNGSDFMQTLLSCLEKLNLELCKLVGIFTHGVLSVTGSANGTVPLLYKQMQEIGFQNELIQYHCIIQ